MINTGTYNFLQVKSSTENRMILTDGQQDVPLTLSSIQSMEQVRVGDEILVFVYKTQSGNFTATTSKPFACTGDFSFLEVVDENELGSFMDLGLDAPLFVPDENQKTPFKIGNEYVVYVYLDNAGQLTASSWLEDYIDTDVNVLDEGEEVSVMISDISPVAYSAIVNNRYNGFLHRQEVHENIETGDFIQAYIRKLKPEVKKIELSLRKPGFEFIIESKDNLLEILKENGGVLNLGDKSAPEDIRKQLKMSKKSFKQAIGGLYKERLITISDYQIGLVDNSNRR